MCTTVLLVSLCVFGLSSVGEEVNDFPNTAVLPVCGVIHVIPVLLDFVREQANLLPLAMSLSPLLRELWR